MTTTEPTATETQPRPACEHRWRLPGPCTARTGVPRAEVAAFAVVVPLLSVPVLLASMTATWALVLSGVGSLAVLLVLLRRGAAVADGWVAHRRLGRWRLVPLSQVHAVQYRETAHGGHLYLANAAGRGLRLRVPQWDAGNGARALADAVRTSGARVDDRAAGLLGLPEPSRRLATAAAAPELQR